MKFHKTFRPGSWTKQAREFAYKMFYQYKEALTKPEEFIEVPYYHGTREGEYMGSRILGTHSHEYWVAYFQNSYRHPMITNRAAKKFGELCRKHNM